MAVEKKQFYLSQNNGTKHRILVTSHRHLQKRDKHKSQLVFFPVSVIEDKETYPPAKNQEPQ